MTRTMAYLLVLLAACAGALAATTEPDIEWLFVQNAQSVTLENGVLTLHGVSPSTVFFSDRPERMAALGLTSEFVTFWTTGGGSDNFKKDPPNATLSVAAGGTMDDIVLELRSPKLEGDTLSYEVTVLEGDEQVKGGPSSLFVDVIGMPLTPVSAAGVARRTVRRCAFR